MYRTGVFAMVILVMLFSSCVRNKNGQVIQNTPQVNSKVFEVTEVTQTSNYTYLKVKENLGERWVAVSKQEINTGDVFYYEQALQMNNFESKELNHTFEVIYFIDQISKTPLSQNQITGAMPEAGTMPAHSGKVETEQKTNISLDKTEDEISVSQIYNNRDTYSGKEIEIRGFVVKVNKSVMGKNWIHIQDGTSYEGSFDLTITSQDIADVNDEVTFKGQIILNKDFGAGYYYDVIMEDAVLLIKTAAAVQL